MQELTPGFGADLSMLRPENVSPVLHRNLSASPALATGRRDALIMWGRTEVIDLSSGAGVCGLGMLSDEQTSFPDIRGMYLHSQNWTHQKIEELAGILLTNANTHALKGGNWLDGGVMFLNSGTEAVEVACKLALQACYESGRTGAPTYFSRCHSYHGNSLFTLALGDHPRRNPFWSVTNGMPIRKFPAYMPTWKSDDLVSFEEHMEEVLTPLDHVLQVCADDNRPAIVVIEPIGGTTMGIEPASVQYIKRLRLITRKHNAVLVFDEVLSGNWRTGYPYCWQLYQAHSSADVSPDIVAMGKGLANGAAPLSAVVMSGHMRAALRSRRVWHSSTFQNQPYACALGVAVQMLQVEIGALRERLIKILHESVVPRLQGSRNVFGVYGLGALYGVRLDPIVEGLHVRVREKLLEQGVNVYTDGQSMMFPGTPAQGNMLLFAPPFVIRPDVLERAVETVIKVVGSTA